MSSVDQHMSDLGIVPDHVADFAKGLRALAAFLEDHPDFWPEFWPHFNPGPDPFPA